MLKSIETSSMELEILQENLKTALSIISRVLTTRPQMAILSNVLLKADTGGLEIVGSNLETTIVTTVGAKVKAAGDFTVPGRTFSETINSLSAEKITLLVEEGFLALSGGKFKARINGLPAAEFPKLTNIEGESKSWSLSKKDFQKAITKTIFAAALDESRAVLTGVLFKSTKEGLILAATDGFRLSVTKVPTKNELPEEHFIIPAKALTEVSRLLGEGNFILTLFPNTNQVLFDLGDIKIYSRLIAGNFPDFEKIIPPTSTIKIVVSTDELLKAIKLASIFARDSANIVKLKLEDNKLKISANAPQAGENESEVDVQTEKTNDEGLTIAFNYRYFLDLLANLETTELSIELNGPLASGLFKLPQDPNFLHIIMPVRVQS